MKRNKREHGRILSVETMQRGSALAADVAAAATSITVDDAGDFDEDGGWLYIGTQVVEFTACNDDTGVITLAAGLTAAAEQGDPVHVYDPLYGEVVDYQVALVVLDGEHDNPDPVQAEVAESVEDLPEGDRGKAGESCTLLRVADDEWEVVEVGGRSRKSRGIRFEADDVYVLSAADITAASATMPLSRRPVDEGLVAFYRGFPQQPTEYTINYDAQTITWPLSGFEREGHVLWFHYAYRKGVATATVVEPPPPATPFTYVGGAFSSGGSTTLTSQALPAGTQVGDLLVLTAVVGSHYGSGALSVSDSRFTKVSDMNYDPSGPGGIKGGAWVGTATTLDPITLNADPGTGGTDTKKVEVVALRGASVDMARTGLVTTSSNNYTAPGLSGAGGGAVLCVVGKHGAGSAYWAGADGYTSVFSTSDTGDYCEAAMAYRHDAVVPASAASWVFTSGSVKSVSLAIGLA